MELEIWKEIPGYALYEASNLGRIRSKYNNKYIILKPASDNRGYIHVVIYNLKTKKTFKVHQLIAMAFLNHKPDKFNLVVNHINFDRKDNRLINLELVTNRENTNKKHLFSTSKYIGVHWSTKSKKWRSSISINRKKVHLGFFNSESIAYYHYELALKNINLFNGNPKQFRETLKQML